MDCKIQVIAIKYAKYLKPLIKSNFNINIRIKHFPALMETLTHDFMLNRPCDGKSLTEMLQFFSPTFQLTGNSLPYAVFKTTGLSAIDKGQNPYIHAALRIFKSLTAFSNPYLPKLHEGHESYRGLKRIKWEGRKRHTQFLKQRKRYYINYGKIYRLRRQLRLRKLRPGINHAVFECHCTYLWNHDLAALLIPILHHCPKSDKLLALINRRFRHVYLKYTPRRRLRDAVYSYIRRVTDAENNC